MQFISNGPDIPEALLQAHEEGRVVFFCGAGISYRVGLKDFKWLVDEIYRRCGTEKTSTETLPYGKGLYDTTLNILQERLPNQRHELREALAKALAIKAPDRDMLEIHRALLELGRNREGALRLVTTNYDRAFELVSRREKSKFNRFSAPLLPVPKVSQWNGLVYLHGLLPANHANRSALDQLVVTSGDFGLAYLTERWAAKFVGELFRNFIVCFVGYSVSDPVLRYMMDALAADRLRGEGLNKAYALVEVDEADEEKSIDTWKSKGIDPIPYDASDDHIALHETLRVWADDHRDGVRGKERVVVEYAMSNPSESTREDDFVGRMLWALSDKTGRPAQLFADFDPVPTLAWLEVFSERRFREEDLNRFGVRPELSEEKNLQFSLLQRPAPYRLAPPMALVSRGVDVVQWDSVMWHLARWIVQHLNDPALVIWLVEQDGHLHESLARLVERKLAEIAKLEAKGNEEELRRISAKAPNAIPGQFMRNLWGLLLAGRVKCGSQEPDPNDWFDRFKREGTRAIVRLQLRQLLAPKIKVRKPWRWHADDGPSGEVVSINQLVDCELVLAADDVRSTLGRLRDDPWRERLPRLFDEFQQLLWDTMDLLSELGKANEYDDLSYWHLPSISDHPQNSGSHEWVVLIELLRDAWLEILACDTSLAASIARKWFDMPYPTFKRLALFAAAQGRCIPSDEWVDWLVEDQAWWLWSLQTKRETLRLLVSQGMSLSPASRTRLETVILEGPPRRMYREDLESEWWERHVKESVWLLLAKLAHEEEALGLSARERLRQVPDGWPNWKSVRDGERNEFSYWMGGAEDPEFEGLRQVSKAPRRRRELVQWLTKPAPTGNQVYEDDWHEVCQKRFFHCLAALCDLARQEIWPGARWRGALQAWGEERLARRSWRHAGRLVCSMPDDVLSENLHSVARWLERVSKSADQHETVLWELCGRVLNQRYEPDTNGLGPVTHAINDPVGMVVECLLNSWFRHRPGDGDGLPKPMEPLMSRLCDVREDRFRGGRLILASRAIALFRIDRNWSEEHLLPLFDWSADPVEARAAWEGFLSFSRLYPPLMYQLKDEFLSTVDHCEDLVESGRNFPRLLTIAALERMEGFQAQDFRDVMRRLSADGLREAAYVLAGTLESAGKQREQSWRNRVRPILRDVWPKFRDRRTRDIAEAFAYLAIAAGEEFPDALAEVRGWLIPIEHVFGVVGRMEESGLCGRFPSEAVGLLFAVVDSGSWGREKAASCLKEASEASPNLQTDLRYRQLEDLCGQA